MENFELSFDFIKHCFCYLKFTKDYNIIKNNFKTKKCQICNKRAKNSRTNKQNKNLENGWIAETRFFNKINKKQLISRK